MRQIYLKKYSLSLLLLVSIASFGQSKLDVKKEFEFAAKQYEGMLAAHQDLTKFPQSTQPDGTPRDMKSDWWCSGFFGGSLWYIYQYNNDPKMERCCP